MNILEKKETKILAVAVMIILVIIVGVMLYIQNNLKQTKNSLEHEAGQELVFDAQKYFDVDDEKAAEIVFDALEVNVNVIGEYKATATFKRKTYTIKVNVVDTSAPKVDMLCRYVFTNDVANADLSGLFEGIYDASEYATKLIRYEYKGNLDVMDDKALNGLTEQINTYAKDDELKNLGATDIPTEEGVYRAVVEIADVHGNAAYEEIVLILDKTGAKIEDVADKTITVSADKLMAEPIVDKSEYIITDNVDGKIKVDDITCQLELRDEAKHEWLVHVSYVDRAGNESKADFLITVKEGDVESARPGNNGGNANEGDSSNPDNDKKPTNNLDISTWEPTDDEDVISPYMQMVIDAGYGVVVKIDDGVYAVLTHGDGCVNGKSGSEILREYLAELDLEPNNVSGGWIEPDKDWYWFKAYNLHELVTPDEEEFWD